MTFDLPPQDRPPIEFSWQYESEEKQQRPKMTDSPLVKKIVEEFDPEKFRILVEKTEPVLERFVRNIQFKVEDGIDLDWLRNQQVSYLGNHPSIIDPLVLYLNIHRTNLQHPATPAKEGTLISRFAKTLEGSRVYTIPNRKMNMTEAKQLTHDTKAITLAGVSHNIYLSGERPPSQDLIGEYTKLGGLNVILNTAKRNGLDILALPIYSGYSNRVEESTIGHSIPLKKRAKKTEGKMSKKIAEAIYQVPDIIAYGKRWAISYLPEGWSTEQNSTVIQAMGIPFNIRECANAQEIADRVKEETIRLKNKYLPKLMEMRDVNRGKFGPSQRRYSFYRV